MIGGPLLAPKKAWAPVDAQELYNVIWVKKRRV